MRWSGQSRVARYGALAQRYLSTLSANGSKLALPKHAALCNAGKREGASDPGKRDGMHALVVGDSDPLTVLRGGWPVLR
jgi:hypothetical protein